MSEAEIHAKLESITDKHGWYMPPDFFNEVMQLIAATVAEAETAARIDEYQNHFPHRRLKETVWAVSAKDIEDRIKELQSTKGKQKGIFMGALDFGTVISNSGEDDEEDPATVNGRF